MHLDLAGSYESRKSVIKNRLDEFRRLKSSEETFSELCFCLLTPQSKAKLCWMAVTKLKEKNLLLSNDHEKIKNWLAGVRFANNKAKYIAEAAGSWKEIREKIASCSNARELREWLVANVKGLGYKEASHFLRNIGRGEGIAILDRHILKNLLKHGVIREIPRTLTKKRYMEIEERMKEFARNVKIPLADLDLLFWSEETGEVFK